MPIKATSPAEQAQVDSYNSTGRRLDAVIGTARSGGGRRLVLPGQNKKENLDDLELDEGFQQDADLFLNHLGTNDDIFETLRDSDYNIVKGINRAMTAGDWPPEVQQAYGRLRTRFDGAETGSLNQYWEATKDIGIDLISDPTLLASLFAAPFTGGTSVAGRTAAVGAARQGVKRFTVAKLAAGEGILWAGTDNFTRQKIEQEVGLRDEVSGAEVLATAAVGGVLGGVIGKLVDQRAISKVARTLDETSIDERLANEVASPGIFALRPVAKAVAATVGRPATVLDPITQVSPTAAKIQKLFRYDLGQRFSNPLNPTARAVSGRDFSQNYHATLGSRWMKFEEAIKPISFNGSGKLDTDVNEQLITALRKGTSDDAAIGKVAKEIRSIMDDTFKELNDEGLVDSGYVQNYIKRKWNRRTIEANPEKLKKLLMADGQVPNAAVADDVLVELLDKKNQLVDTGAEAFSLSLPRKFKKILDDSKYHEFLDNDIRELTFSYLSQTSKKIASTKTFGVKTQAEFNDQVLGKIVKEARENGKVLNAAERRDISDLYKFATGEGVPQVEGTLGVMKDWTALAFQVSMLPLATLSSITEIVLPLTRVSTPAYAKALAQGIGAGTKKITIDLVNKLGIKHKMTRPQVFDELNRFAIAFDQSSADRIERLSGQTIRSAVAKKASNAFFKANFLTQWTETVQATAFIAGKDLIRSNLTKLSKRTNLDDRAALRMRNELADLGIDFNEGMKWVKGGASQSDAYYLKVQEGAASFTNTIILPTSREAGTKPHIMSNPMTDIFFQFLTYPAAFSNVVVKGMATEMAESPIRGSSKVLGGAVIMTAMARFGNFVRSRGESEEGSNEWEKNRRGLIRWGGNGLMLDMMMRAQQSVAATGSPLGAVAGFTGPLVGETIQSIAYRRGPSQILGTKVPGFGAGRAVFGKDLMDDYTTFLREQDKKLVNIITGGGTEKSTNLFR